jgi:RNA polymerase sigma factor (sigma-70 family)
VPKHKHQVTNAEFNTARKQHLELITSLTKRYSNVLSPETLAATGDIALWRCLQNFDPQFGQKVSSSLYRFIHWECLRAIQEKNKNPSVSMMEDVEGDSTSVATGMILNDYLSLLTVKARRIVEAKFLENRTFAEIARIEGYSKQGIKNIVDRSVVVMAEAAHAA